MKSVARHLATGRRALDVTVCLTRPDSDDPQAELLDTHTTHNPYLTCFDGDCSGPKPIMTRPGTLEWKSLEDGAGNV